MLLTWTLTLPITAPLSSSSVRREDTRAYEVEIESELRVTDPDRYLEFALALLDRVRCARDVVVRDGGESRFVVQLDQSAPMDRDDARRPIRAVVQLGWTLPATVGDTEYPRIGAACLGIAIRTSTVFPSRRWAIRTPDQRAAQ